MSDSLSGRESGKEWMREGLRTGVRGLEGGRRDESSKHPHPCKISVKYPHPSTGWPGSNVTEKSCRQRDTHTGGGVRGMNPQVGLRGMKCSSFFGMELSNRVFLDASSGLFLFVDFVFYQM